MLRSGVSSRGCGSCRRSGCGEVGLCIRSLLRDLSCGLSVTTSAPVPGGCGGGAGAEGACIEDGSVKVVS